MTEPKKVWRFEFDLRKQGKEDFIVQKVKGCKDQVFRLLAGFRGTLKIRFVLSGVVRNEIPAELLPLLTMAFTEEQRQQIFKQARFHTLMILIEYT